MDYCSAKEGREGGRKKGSMRERREEKIIIDMWNTMDILQSNYSIWNKTHKKSIHYMTEFIEYYRKFKLMRDDRNKISCCLGKVGGGFLGKCDYQGKTQTFAGYGDGFSILTIFIISQMYIYIVTTY